MSILCWNVRGANLPTRVHTLKERIRREKHAIVCLLEHKIRRMRRFFHNIWKDASFMDNGESADRGRILILWDPAGVTITKLDESFQMMHIGVTLAGQSTVVYAANDRLGRQELWEEIDRNRLPNDTPWIILGDFHTIRHAGEKSSMAGPDVGAMADFNDCIDRNQLREIPSVDESFQDE